jgi:hypothetical protein
MARWRDSKLKLEDGVVIRLIPPTTDRPWWEFSIEWTDGFRTLGAPFATEVQAKSNAMLHYKRLSA